MSVPPARQNYGSLEALYRSKVSCNTSSLIHGTAITILSAIDQNPKSSITAFLVVVVTALKVGKGQGAILGLSSLIALRLFSKDYQANRTYR